MTTGLLSWENKLDIQIGGVETGEYRQSRELRFYLIKFSIRVILAVCVFALWFANRDALASAILHPFEALSFQSLFLAALWVFFILMMVSHIFPTRLLTIAGKKATAAGFSPAASYDADELRAFSRQQNKRALAVLLASLAINAAFGILYLAGFLNAADLLLLTMVYFLCDYMFILFYCPFQSLFMKNKCCINCRIYDWGHFLMFLPMAFVGGVFGLSLFLMSLVVLIRWEILWRLHPERFYEGSNKSLQCVNCKEKTCQIKTAIAKNWKQ